MMTYAPVKKVRVMVYALARKGTGDDIRPSEEGMGDNIRPSEEGTGEIRPSEERPSEGNGGGDAMPPSNIIECRLTKSASWRGVLINSSRS